MFHQPVFKKMTPAGLNNLRQKEYQISVKNWIFDDPFQKRAIIDHFGARDDPTIEIRKKIDELGP